MFIFIAICVDVIHAIAMMLWVIGLPLLFYNKYPSLSIGYAIYSILFIIINQLSHYYWGHCIFTVLSNYYYKLANSNVDTGEWFSIRFARYIFGLTPTHKGVNIATQLLIMISSFGCLFFCYSKATGK